jgi:bifunctional non-homologous end joining protein LigD
MALTEYKKKRTFKKTPEPKGGKALKKQLRFVIQKHDATRLHYDFRLELNGVLKSWAVPKGPSLNPADKRLAVQVEDHPYDYKNFEGIIPEGNYGAGTVIIWDEGTYEPLEYAASKTAQEKLVLRDLQKGSLKFRLKGRKLEGEFALVKMKGRGENAWLLIKHRDEFASKVDITTHDESVISGKTNEQLSEDSGAEEWKSNRAAKAAKRTTAKKTPVAGVKKAVVRKRVTPATKTATVAKKATVKGARSKIVTPAKPARKTSPGTAGETRVVNVNDHDLKFTNLGKLYWPEDGVTKRDMLDYYYQVAPYMLPYMKDRPQTLNRFPNGIHGKSFYQKDVTGKVPEWIETYKYFSEGDEREKHFMVCTDEASLLYIASLGCIEMNPWSSRTAKPDHPDWCVIDLDPDKRNTFDQVVEAALVTKSVLDVLELPSCCKTSGSTGLHIYIPLGAKYTYEESKEFARAVVTLVHAQLPAYTTLERTVSARRGKMYLDFLQNRPQATLAGPYSLRPKPGAPVSMPLHWHEVKKGLKINDFNITNALPRLRETGDLFGIVLESGIDMEQALVAMKSVFDKMK